MNEMAYEPGLHQLTQLVVRRMTLHQLQRLEDLRADLLVHAVQARELFDPAPGLELHFLELRRGFRPLEDTLEMFHFDPELRHIGRSGPALCFLGHSDCLLDCRLKSQLRCRSGAGECLA